ncbi:MAG: hypothetical protein HYZ89_06305 [Candidatus Omnitrophica bacterium]|nr:hypothetical protein [Candidatus Omnitrophota bacterium]
MEIYRARMPGPGALIEERAATLARLRCEERYMAKWARQRDRTLELVENHCSIAKAGRFCPRLCAGELSLFRAVLGDNVSVERVEHILSGDRRCTYRIIERFKEPVSDNPWSLMQRLSGPRNPALVNINSSRENRKSFPS